MTAHELVIRLGRPFDLQGDSGWFLADVREITVPFSDRESAEAAQREITVSVRPARDAGGDAGPYTTVKPTDPRIKWTDGDLCRCRT